MTAIDLKQLSKAVTDALEAGKRAAEASDDGGTSNRDSVEIWGLSGIRSDTLARAGIPGFRTSDGRFVLRDQSGGQGNKRASFALAAFQSLRNAGVDCTLDQRMD